MAEATVLIRGGEVLGTSGLRRADVLIRGGIVAELGPDLSVPKGATVLEADGAVVGPGLVDLHTHLRQPGREEAETVASGARAAALGGYTAIVAMPNTEPSIDSADTVREVRALAEGVACLVAPAGAITVERKGERLAPLAEMAALGVRIFTDDGAGVQDGALMRRALEYAGGLRSSGIPVLLAQHCEDEALADGGCVHEGVWSSLLGLPGMPASAEEVMAFRDVTLSHETGVPVHLLHLSTAGSIEIVRRAKAAGIAVTCEAAPHHFTLSDECVRDFDPVFRVNPPLRGTADVEAVQAGLRGGIVDAIATDHAPHAPEMKDLPFDEAPPGMLGLETALSLAIGELGLPLERVFALMSTRPASLACLERHGRFPEIGSPANLCVIDPTATWTVDPLALASRSRNTPYAGRKMTGHVRHTLFEGEPTVIDSAATR